MYLDLPSVQQGRDSKAYEVSSTSVLDHVPTESELTFQWYTPVLQNRAQQSPESVYLLENRAPQPGQSFHKGVIFVAKLYSCLLFQIGRASCRERV